MLKALFNVFDANAQAERKLKREIDSAHVYSSDIKRKFRLDAIRELAVAHEDITFLMSHSGAKFCAYSKKAGIFYSGYFGDRIVPTVDFVPLTAPFAEREKVLTTFLKDIKGGYPFPNYRFRKTGNLSSHSNDGWYEKSLGQKGYKIKDPVEDDELFGLIISLDKKPIIINSVWDPQPNGALTRALFNTITNELPLEKTRIISVEIFEHYRYETIVHRVDEMYNGLNNFKGELGLKSFKSHFGGFVEFLTAIEVAVKTLPKIWREDEDEVEAHYIASSTPWLTHHRSQNPVVSRLNDYD